MEQPQQKIKKLIYISLIFKTIDVIANIMIIGNTPDNMAGSIILGAALFYLLAFFVTKGYRIPLYFWAISAVFSVLSMTQFPSLFGVSMLVNVIILYDSIFIIFFAWMVFYLLLNKDMIAYFAEQKELRKKPPIQS